jgi:septum formation protein
MAHPRLILASRSPRRAQLLREAGFDFRQCDPPFDDPPHPQHGGQSPPAVAMAIAGAKAMSFLTGDGIADQDSVVLAADTLIVHDDGQMAGTPTSADDALAMIRRFAGRRHQVVTGVAIRELDRPAPLTFADTAVVALGPVSEDELRLYIQSGAWRGKAGGYNLLERQAAGWPVAVEGEPTTVVGLPMPLVIAHLGRVGILADRR